MGYISDYSCIFDTSGDNKQGNQYNMIYIHTLNFQLFGPDFTVENLPLQKH